MNTCKTAVVLGMAMVVSLTGADRASAQTINGAGASFPYPLYSQWAYKYNETVGVKINYQSIGSGGGIAQIKAETVDYGASDAPLAKSELDGSGLIQFPMVMGGVTPVVNIKGITEGQLKLTGDVLARIYLGEIKKWNDPRIAAVNPGLKLPATAISVVHRADGSGTTWIFTNYLEKTSAGWKSKVGSGTAVEWPAGIGGKGNEGVAINVQRINGAIGYVEYAYALQNKLAYVSMQNKAGEFVNPTIETFQSAAANADWTKSPGFYVVLTDQPGKESWPITGATFILLRKGQDSAQKANTMLSFFQWCYEHGDQMAVNLHYVPMPENVVSLVYDQWRTALTANGSKVW